jgi:HlyD family secretion protein
VKNNFVITIVLSILALGLAVTGCAPNPSVFSTPIPLATVSSVPASKTTSAASLEFIKGRVVPVRYARLGFNTNGLVAKVMVQDASLVKAGDLLAQLDTTDLELQVKSAEDSLAVARATLAQTKALRTDKEIAAAQAAYDSAQVSLRQAQLGASFEERIMLKADYEKAQAALGIAQFKYDRAGGTSNPYIGMMPESYELQETTANFKKAEAAYIKATQPDPAKLAQAQSQLAQAEADLKLKQQGPKPEDVAVQEARVKQAETALVQAQAGLAKARLVAPMDGVINGWTLHTGETVQPGTAIGSVVDSSEFRVETTELDEYRVSTFKVGAPVSISVDALPNKSLKGKVLYIVSPQVPLSSDSKYVATITLDVQDPDIRYGMTVQIDVGAQ